MTLTRLPAPGRVWDPTQQQFAERDTTFLLDPDADTAAGAVLNDPDTRGFFDLYVDNVSHPANVVAGKYRKGINPATATAWWWAPVHGLLSASEFTIEFFAKCTADWQAASAATLLLIGDSGSAQYVEVAVTGANQLMARAQQTQSTNGLWSAVGTLANGDMPADTQFSIAVTLSGGTMRLYRNGVQFASVAGMTSPFVWDGENRSAGITIGSGPQGTATQFTISDVRISRKARTPGQAPVLGGADRSTIAVSASTTGKTVKKLAGTLHAFVDGGGNVSTPGSAYQSAHGGIRVVRTDKFLTVTPIKAGGTDATHPNAGHSGSYSYDWQVVDRSMDYITGTLGCEAYISLDAVPQLLGGSVAPYSGTQLTTGYAYQSQYPSGPPNNNASFATMCADLAYHLITEKGYSVPYMGLWNEPDGGQFWENNANAIPDYCALYNAVVTAVKAVAPAVKFGGPEVGGWHSNTTQDTFIDGLISYCGTNSLPLDFISWHYYTGDLSEPYQVQRFVAAQTATAGLSMPELICGEGCWQLAWASPFGGSDRFFKEFHNDFHAAFYAAALVNMQAAGVVRAIFNGGDGSASLFADTAGVPYSNYNTAKLWTMTEGNSVLSTVQTNDPGVFAIASKNLGTGKVYVFLASIHYRKDFNYPVLLDVSAVASNGTAVTTYLVDDAHSNQLDAGTAHADLETAATTIGTSGTSVVSSGKVGINLRPRACALLVIG